MEYLHKTGFSGHVFSCELHIDEPEYNEKILNRIFKANPGIKELSYLIRYVAYWQITWRTTVKER